ncbi:hypothetical protein C8J56DRAFT_918243 [Mycena floridula]|nr:hypothetical protein C8J56DRAFT_918243 [Mycena floridula]
MSPVLYWASIILLLVLHVRAELSITAPSGITACQTASISWQGGTGPYQLQVVPGSHAGPSPMRILAGSVSGNVFSWKVDIAAGTSIALVCKDSTGAQALTQAFSVAACSNTGDTGSNSSDQSQTQKPTTSTTSDAPTGGTSTTATTGGSQSTPTSNVGSAVSKQPESSGSNSSTGTFKPTGTSDSLPPTSSTGLGASDPTITTPATHSSSSVGPVAGSISGLVVLLLVAALCVYYYRYRRRRRHRSSSSSDKASLHPFEMQGLGNSTPPRTSIGRSSSFSSPSLIEPFMSPTSVAPSSQWTTRPPKRGFSGAYPRSPGPWSATDSSVAETAAAPAPAPGPAVLTPDQVTLVQQLNNLNVHPSAMAAVIDRMLVSPRGSGPSTSDSSFSGRNREMETTDPPAYESPAHRPPARDLKR